MKKSIIGSMFRAQFGVALYERDILDWPTTITTTRYAGAIEGGAWAAFPVVPADLVRELWDARDARAAEWWREAERLKLPIGVGSNPASAHADMVAKIRAKIAAEKPSAA